MSNKIVTINGAKYDAHTGLLLRKPSHQTRNSQSFHVKVNKSKTLKRSVVSNTTIKQIDGIVRKRIITQKSPLISRFNSTKTNHRTANIADVDLKPVVHPLHSRVLVKQDIKKSVQSIPKPARLIKDEAIAKAISQTPKRQDSIRLKKHRRHLKIFSIASIVLTLLIIGSYLSYLNIPAVSVYIARSQSGINASYPEYKPDGYVLDGPIKYSAGTVSMKFSSAGGENNYTIQESKSVWDSSALKEHYVRQNAGKEPTIHTERGLVFYMHDNNATWVNKGILYAISGNAPLSTDQLRRIATSL